MKNRISTIHYCSQITISSLRQRIVTSTLELNFGLTTEIRYPLISAALSVSGGVQLIFTLVWIGVRLAVMFRGVDGTHEHHKVSGSDRAESPIAFLASTANV